VQAFHLHSNSSASRRTKPALNAFARPTSARPIHRAVVAAPPRRRIRCGVGIARR
jgi:hypothetical protein